MLSLYLENAYGMSGLTSACSHQITWRFQMTSESRGVLEKVNSQIREGEFGNTAYSLVL